MMPFDVPTKEEMVGWLWENKRAIVAKLKDVYAWFRGSGKNAEKTGILILGAGGVGKTTLARLLSGEFDLLFDAMQDYDESISIEQYALKDTPNVEIVVPPGQSHRREATWTGLHADLSAGKYRGVILVSAYGYHSIGEQSYKNHRLFKGNKDAFLKAFLKQKRLEEIAILRQLQPHLQANQKKLWFVSLIAKQDLWWRNHAEVEKHYQEKDYGKVLRQIGKVSGDRIRHEFVFASMVIGNLVTKKDERLKPNAEGYDFRLQIQSLRRLFETVDSLKEWEG